MALGAVALVTSNIKNAGEAVFVEEITVVGDGSYPTGGSAGLPALVKTALGGRDVAILQVNRAGACGGFTPVWVPSTQKLMVRRTAAINAADEEVPNATNLSGTTFQLQVLCK